MSDKNVNHTKWMKRAIFLASLGKNTTSPNPRVGAVILDKNGSLISEGFHFKAGMPHAEAMALNNLKKDAKGGTMYVNLEPCCHKGKTPPCVDKVISSGLKKVYIYLALFLYIFLINSNLFFCSKLISDLFNKTSRAFLASLILSNLINKRTSNSAASI